MQMSAYDNQTESGRINFWQSQRANWELQMRQAFLEGQSLASQIRYVREVTDGQTLI